MDDVMHWASAWLKAISFNAFFSIGGLGVTMLVFYLSSIDNWWALALLAWVFHSISATLMSSWMLDSQ